MQSILNNLKKVSWHAKYFGLNKLIYSAGMPRSGSTLLYNIIRLILSSKYSDKLSHGWIEEVNEIPKGEVYLIKTHHLNRMMTWRAFKTFYTFRDIRDVLVSRQKMFKKEPSIEIVRFYIQQDQIAKKYADKVFSYDLLTNETIKVTNEISESLQISVKSDQILKLLPNPASVSTLKSGHSKQTLLHKNHVTGTKKLEWKDVLSDNLIRQIHNEYDWWFLENGYKI